jgi:hypothetical protein
MKEEDETSGTSSKEEEEVLRGVFSWGRQNTFDDDDGYFTSIFTPIHDRHGVCTT